MRRPLVVGRRADRFQAIESSSRCENLCLYRRAIGSASHWIIELRQEPLFISWRHRIRKPLNHRGLELLRGSLGHRGIESVCHPIVVEWSCHSRHQVVIRNAIDQFRPTPTLASSESLVDCDDRYTHHRSTSPISDESIIHQDANTAPSRNTRSSCRWVPR